MFGAIYLTYSQIYEKRVPLQTLKKRLGKLNRVNALTNLSAVNAISAFNKFFESREKTLPEMQKLWRDSYLSKSIQSDIEDKNLQDRLIFTRLQNLILAQFSLMYSTDESPTFVDVKTEGGFELGELSLIASDFLFSTKEENSISQGSDRKRVKHLGFQLAPIVEALNPLDIVKGIVRSEIIYSKILNSAEFEQILIDKKVESFDIAAEFEKATKISLTDYIDITLAILWWQLFPENQTLEIAQFFTPKGFLRKSIFDENVFRRYLKLESRKIDKLRNLFIKEKRYLRQFNFVNFKAYSLIEFANDAYFCIDPFFLSEKLNSGIYWKIFDKLSGEKKEMFSPVFGYIFELYIKQILEKVTSTNNYFVKNGLLLSAPEYSKGDESVDFIIYYPETKHLVLIECKASFLHSEAKYGKSVRRFENEIKKKFIIKEDGTDKGVGQLAKNIGRLFNKEKSKRSHINNSDFDYWIQIAEKISPVLITQEPNISFHINEDMLNQAFRKRLSKESVKDGVKVSQLTVIDVEFLEKFKQNLINGDFTLEQCLNFRTLRDPNYKNFFPQFISDNFRFNHVEDKEDNIIFDTVNDRIKYKLFGDLE